MRRTPFLHILILLVFLANSLGPVPCALADPAFGGAVEFRLPAPGVMVQVSPEFDRPEIKGILINPDNPLKFDFLFSQGDGSLTEAQKKETYDRGIRYFLSALTLPEKHQWVNLSAYEHNRMIPRDFGMTMMGRDLLAQDYILKQITASLIYPEGAYGKKFWAKVYALAQKKYGSTDIPVNTFNKVWIVPDEALVYEMDNGAMVIKSRLKVMLEQDYLALEKNQRQPGDMTSVVSPSLNNRSTRKIVNALGSQVIREIVLPVLQQEVNTGKNFSLLRQVYSAMILAAWYKRALKNSILGQVYSNRAKMAGISQNQISNNEQIYRRYLKSLHKGVFNYIKEDLDPVTGEVIPRKYISGGFSPDFDRAMHTTKTLDADGQSRLSKIISSGLEVVRTGLKTISLAGIKITKSRVPVAFIGGLIALQAMGLHAVTLTQFEKDYILNNAIHFKDTTFQQRVTDVQAVMDQGINKNFQEGIVRHRRNLFNGPEFKVLSDLVPEAELMRADKPFDLLQSRVRSVFAGLYVKKANGSITVLELKRLGDLEEAVGKAVNKIVVFNYEANQAAVGSMLTGANWYGNCDAHTEGLVFLNSLLGNNSVYYAEIRENEQGEFFPQITYGTITKSQFLKADPKGTVLKNLINTGLLQEDTLGLRLVHDGVHNGDKPISEPSVMMTDQLDRIWNTLQKPIGHAEAVIHPSDGRGNIDIAQGQISHPKQIYSIENGRQVSISLAQFDNVQYKLSGAVNLGEQDAGWVAFDRMEQFSGLVAEDDPRLPKMLQTFQGNLSVAQQWSGNPSVQLDPVLEGNFQSAQVNIGQNLEAIKSLIGEDNNVNSNVAVDPVSQKFYDDKFQALNVRFSDLNGKDINQMQGELKSIIRDIDQLIKEGGDKIPPKVRDSLDNLKVNASDSLTSPPSTFVPTSQPGHDVAMLRNGRPVGGINLDAKLLKLKVRSNSLLEKRMAVKLNFNKYSIAGFDPIIEKIFPASQLPQIKQLTSLLDR